MPVIYNVLLIVQIVVSVAIIVLVLMQQGKGADAGAAFGSGASGTVFGARGAANFLSRTTAILATVFFLNSIALAYLASGRTVESGSLMDKVVQQPVPVEAVPAPTASDVPPAPSVTSPSVSPVPVSSAGVTDVPPAPLAGTEPAAQAAQPADKSSEQPEKPVQQTP